MNNKTITALAVAVLPLSVASQIIGYGIGYVVGIAAQCIAAMVVLGSLAHTLGEAFTHLQ